MIKTEKLAATIFAQLIAKDHVQGELQQHETDKQHLQNVAAVAFMAAQNFTLVAARHAFGKTTFEDLTNTPAPAPAPKLKDWETFNMLPPEGRLEEREKRKGELWRVEERIGLHVKFGIRNRNGELWRTWSDRALKNAFGGHETATLDEVCRVNNLSTLGVLCALDYCRVEGI